MLIQHGKVVAYAFIQLRKHELIYPALDLKLATMIFALKT